MIRHAILALTVALVLVLAAPAAASVRALAPRPPSGGGPVLAQGRVIYAVDAGRRALPLRAQPATGGVATEVARVPLPRSRLDSAGWDLAAGAAGLALRVTPADRPRQLWAGVGPLTLVEDRLRAGPAMADEQALFAVPGGPLVLERTDRRGVRLRAMLRPPGAPARRLPLPAGADLHHLAAAGAMAAVAIPRSGDIALLELPSGAVLRRFSMGDFAGTQLIGLAVSATGDVAIAVEDGSGADFLGWAPAGAAQPTVVASGDEFGLVRTAGGRIAMQQPAVQGDGTHVVVIDPSGPVPRELFRGPPAAAIRTLDYDGTRVAWATDGCQLVADATPAASTGVVPAGPCVRTEASFVLYDLRPRGRPPTVRVRVRCLTAPGRRCRIDLRLSQQTRIGRVVARVPVGRARMLRVPVSRRAAQRLRRSPGPVILDGWVVDPDGRRRHAILFI